VANKLWPAARARRRAAAPAAAEAALPICIAHWRRNGKYA